MCLNCASGSLKMTSFKTLWEGEEVTSPGALNQHEVLSSLHGAMCSAFLGFTLSTRKGVTVSAKSSSSSVILYYCFSQDTRQSSKHLASQVKPPSMILPI